MQTVVPAWSLPRDDAVLIRRVNELYHALAQESFDDDHRHRHRAEAPFWHEVARTALAATPTTKDVATSVSRVVVDFACGTGFVSRNLASWMKPTDRLVAIDVSQAALDTTARKIADQLTPGDTAPQLQCLSIDSDVIPMPDASVDLFAINAALHHLPHPDATLREIDRVLKPGGHFALGFEPNRTHFGSTAMRELARAVARARWYASPRQNRRRLRRYLNLGPDAAEPAMFSDEAVAASVSRQLAREGLIADPLSAGRILDLVDPHARGARDEAGFDPATLLRETMPRYDILRLFTSDYLGEGVRPVPFLRATVDAVMRAALPRHGSLFSWLVRKPASEAEGGQR